MSVATAVVGVALVPRAASESAELAELVQFSRSTAVRRAETMRLAIAQSGAWTLGGTASAAAVPRSGRLRNRLPEPIAVLFSPFGTCAPDLRTELSARVLALDPVTCDPPTGRDRRTRGAPRD